MKASPTKSTPIFNLLLSKTPKQNYSGLLSSKLSSWSVHSNELLLIGGVVGMLRNIISNPWIVEKVVIKKVVTWGMLGVANLGLFHI